jgi:hypothetical protein
MTVGRFVVMASLMLAVASVGVVKLGYAPDAIGFGVFVGAVGSFVGRGFSSI